jgi:hypothetical protein
MSQGLYGNILSKYEIFLLKEIQNELGVRTEVHL